MTRLLTSVGVAIIVYAAIMLIGWTQARYVTPQMTAGKASGGADLYANNPFVKGDKK